MIVLLPPSEGKAPGGRGTFSPAGGAFGGALGEARRAVAAAVVTDLDRGGPVARARLFGTDGPLAVRASDAARALATGTAPALPAWRRFTGVVWEHLDPATLPAPARRRIVVPTATLGLCGGDDPVPDFRLKLTVRLDALGRLDRWWRPMLGQALAGRRGPIVDLLPNEHAAAVDLGERHVVRVSFVGSGHAAKAVKGRLARAILLHGLDAVDGFRWEGWRATREGEGIVVRGSIG